MRRCTTIITSVVSATDPWVVRLLLTLVVGAGVACSGEAPPKPAEPVSRSLQADPVAAATVNITGQAPTPSEGAPSIIILHPDAPSDVPVPTEPAVMDQFGRDFIPRQLLVRLGQPVLFKNSEDDLHTVHLKDEEGASLFNVAMPIRGGSHETLLTEPGDYAVSCEAHQEMSATVFVLTTPYAAIADRAGVFAIPDVAIGRYTLVLRQGEQRHEEPIEITADRHELTLEFPAGS